MKHAFLIMAYNNWGQLRKLISLLDDSRNSIYVHVDAKSTDFDRAKFNGIVQNASLYFTPRMKVSWGGSNQIECELLLLKEALQSNCDYYHLLSGMDLPLHNMDYIDAFFHRYNGKEFVHFTELGETVTPQTFERISIWYPLQNLLGRYAAPFNRFSCLAEPIFGINRLRKCSSLIFGRGANWFSITRDFAHYVVDVWPKYKYMFSCSFCADEIFLQTILLNSPYAMNIYHPQPDDRYESIMRLIDWKRGGPYIFKKEDFEDLVTSPMLFARKFDQREDNVIITKLVTYLQNTKNDR